jgi:hypothetical protein
MSEQRFLFLGHQHLFGMLPGRSVPKKLRTGLLRFIWN